MRKLWLVAVSGAIVALLGTAGAVGLGGDDWLDSPPRLLNTGGEAAVVTPYGVLSNAFRLRISATSSDGEVFVGTGHVIDVEDYVSETRTRCLDRFTPLELSQSRCGAANRPELPVPPTAVDFWLSKATGPGAQSVTGDFAGQPVMALVASANGRATGLTVSIGSQVPGAFATCLTITGLGLTMVALAVGLSVRRRRGEHAPKPATAQPSPPAAFRIAVVSLCLSTAITASGCTAHPLHDEPFGDRPVAPRSELTRDPLDRLDLAALGADYDRRRNLAITAASAPGYSADAWSTADAGLILGSERFDTAWARVQKSKRPRYTCTSKLGAAFPGIPAHAYPLSVLVTGDMTCDTKGEPARQAVWVFTKARAYDPWRLTASIGPESVPIPAPAAPTSAEAAQLSVASEHVAGFLAGAAAPFSLPTNLVRWRNRATKPTSWSTTRWTSTILPDGIRFGRTNNGAIAAASVLIAEISTAKPGNLMSWNRPWDRIYQQHGSYHQLTRHLGVEVLLQLSGGHVSMLGWVSRDYLDESHRSAR